VSRFRNKYRARRRGQYLGVFATVEEARAAYEENAGNAEGTVGTTGNSEGTPGTLGNDDGTDGTERNGDGTVGTGVNTNDGSLSARATSLAQGIAAIPKRARTFPIRLGHPAHRRFFYDVTDEGLELFGIEKGREVPLGFFDSEEDIRHEIESHLYEEGYVPAYVDSLYEPQVAPVPPTPLADTMPHAGYSPAQSKKTSGTDTAAMEATCRRSEPPRRWRANVLRVRHLPRPNQQVLWVRMPAWPVQIPVRRTLRPRP
jgi:hypothetical protein